MAAETAPRVFAIPAFSCLWLSQTLSSLGDRVHQIALLWWTLDTTGSMAMTGAMLAAMAVPAVVLGPVAGTAADRWPRKRLMVACDLLRAGLVLAVAIAAYQHQLTPMALLAATALLASLNTFFNPAAMAAVPTLVPEAGVLSASAWMEGAQHATGLIGPAIGGLVVAAAGAAGAFAANAASFLVSALLLALIAIPRPARPEAHEPFARAMAGGFRTLEADPTVAGVLLGFAAINWFTMAIPLYMPAFARDVFHNGATGLGQLEMALSAGMVASAVFLARMGAVGRRCPVIMAGLAGVGACELLMGLYPTFPLHLVALAAAGALMGAVNVVIIAFFQTRVPGAELGRFFGLVTSLTMGLMPLSFATYGLLTAYAPPAHWLAINGVCVLLLAAAFRLIPGFAKL